MTDVSARARLRVPVPHEQTLQRVRLTLDGLYQVEEELRKLDGATLTIRGSKFQPASSVDELVSLSFKRRPTFTMEVSRSPLPTVSVAFNGVLGVTVRVDTAKDDISDAWAVYGRVLGLLQKFQRRVWWWAAVVVAVVAVDVWSIGVYNARNVESDVALTCAWIGVPVAMLSLVMFFYADSARVTIVAGANWFQRNGTGVALAVLGGLVGTVSLVVVTHLGLLS